MISRSECINLLLERFPGFQERWQAYQDYWEGEHDKPGLCLEVSEFGIHIQELIQAGKTCDLPAIFSFLEELMVEGNEEVKNAVATCVLENLLNYVSCGYIPAESFVHLLGRESLAYCKAWDELTGAPTPGL